MPVITEEANKKAAAEAVKATTACLDNLTIHPDFPPFPEEAEAEAKEEDWYKNRTNVMAYIAAGLDMARRDIPDIDEFPNIGELEYAMHAVSHAKLLETFRGLSMKLNNSKPESCKRVFVAFVTAMNAKKLKMGERAPIGPTNDVLRCILRMCNVTQATDKDGLVEKIQLLINGFDKFLDI